MIKAVARAHRWQAMIESGQCSSISELAKHESINESYASRILRLTLLAPEFVEAVLDGRPAELRSHDRQAQKADTSYVARATVNDSVLTVLNTQLDQDSALRC